MKWANEERWHLLQEGQLGISNWTIQPYVFTIKRAVQYLYEQVRNVTSPAHTYTRVQVISQDK